MGNGKGTLGGHGFGRGGPRMRMKCEEERVAVDKGTPHPRAVPACHSQGHTTDMWVTQLIACIYHPKFCRKFAYSLRVMHTGGKQIFLFDP